jgi:hypothetical protein
MIEPLLDYYIATVWVGVDADDSGDRQVLRRRASDADDFRHRVCRELQRDPQYVRFGPISVSKVPR